MTYRQVVLRRQLGVGQHKLGKEEEVDVQGQSQLQHRRRSQQHLQVQVSQQVESQL